MLEVVLDTGRTHQIRVQLAEAGFPILGDDVYGLAWPGLTRPALHAERLAFPHPVTGARIECTALLPAELEAAIEAARA